MKDTDKEIIKGIKTIVSAMRKEDEEYGLELLATDSDEWTCYKSMKGFLADISKYLEEGHELCSIEMNCDEIKVLFMPLDR
jgi:hypothetical protein